MSVSSVFTLPAQPVTGEVVRVPLGGDGFSAPLASYTVRDHNVTGDASGTFAQLRVTMDLLYTSLVAFASGSIAQGTELNADFKFGIFGPVTSEVTVLGTQQVIDPLIDPRNCATLWSPPPRLYPGGGEVTTLSMRWLNVLADEYFLNTTIYLFDIRARELTPMGPLLWALTGGDQP